MLLVTSNANTEEKCINQYIQLANGMIVNRYSAFDITVHYTVYEKSALLGKHSSLISLKAKDGFEPGYYGDITTRPLTPELAHLPLGSDERYKAVRTYRKALEKQAEELIKQTFPQDFK